MQLKFAVPFLAVLFLLGSCEIGEKPAKPAKEQQNKVKPAAFSMDTYEKRGREIILLYDTMSTAANEKEMERAAEKLVPLTEAFANDFSGYDEVPEFLFLGARAANGLGRHARAIHMLNRIIKNYGNYDKMPEVLFTKAFIYDEDLDDKPRAKAAYLEVINRFPKNPLAKEAGIMLENLYLSDEDLLKKFRSED